MDMTACWGAAEAEQRSGYGSATVVSYWPVKMAALRFLVILNALG
jgi:hypothetical protein